MIALADGQTVWAVHRGHLLMFAAWAVATAASLAWTRWRDRSKPEPAVTRLRRTLWVWAAVMASGMSAAVHLSVIREHFGESALYGWFFLLLTATQLAWAALVARRPTRNLLTAGAAGSAAVVVLWLSTRTIGIPVGPAAGFKEPFGWPDITASACEFVVTVCSVVALTLDLKVRAGMSHVRHGSDIGAAITDRQRNVMSSTGASTLTSWD